MTDYMVFSYDCDEKNQFYMLKEIKYFETKNDEFIFRDKLKSHTTFLDAHLYKFSSANCLVCF